MDLNKAIGFAQLVKAAYAVSPSDLANSAGKSVAVGGTTYQVITTVYANDLATDLSPVRGTQLVSIGLILQDGAGDVVVAIRGTQGVLEWIHDAEFLQVTCPFLAGAGHTEDGFTLMYESFRTGVDPDSPSVVAAMATLPFAGPVGKVTICGHSLGGAWATLLALDLAANSVIKDPMVYTYASPRVGDPMFANTYNQVLPANSYRIANRIDLVPKLPFPPFYEHVGVHVDLNSVQLFPPKILVQPTIPCGHALASYLHLLSLLIEGGAVIPLDPECVP